MFNDLNEIYFNTVEATVSSVDTLSNCINLMGVDIEDMSNQVKKLQEAFEMLGHRISSNETNISDLQDKLRSVSDATTENPNQKDDLEIFDRIVPTEAFIKYTEMIEWEESDNMFLN